jgi:hypothetical protein
MIVDSSGVPFRRSVSPNVANLTRSGFVGAWQRTQDADLASRAHAASLNLTAAMTCSIWIRVPTDIVAVPVMLCKGNVNTAYLFLLAANKVIFRVAIGAVLKDAADPVDLTRNTWVNFKGIYNGANVVLQRNGSTVATTAATGNIDTNAGVLRVGASDVLGTNTFRGSIYDARLWNTATPGDDISVALSGSESGLVANWRFSDGHGDVVTDFGPNALHLACNSDMWTDRLGLPY